MREIVLDTETTGLDFRQGHRIIEIGCLELHDHVPTGETYHVYINPERDVPQGAVDIHGLTQERLSTEPIFSAVADAFLDFIGSDPLVIHNAGFDVPFLNSELERINRAPITFDRVVDTLLIARQRHPGGSNRLDDLCSRYRIDNSQRTLHGALLDSELLAEVYLELIGGRQTSLTLDSTQQAGPAELVNERAPRPSRVSRLSEDERARHSAFVESLGPDALWRRYTSSN
ncbi:MAG: DNA polymerase III subunit epsilon [Pseudomonadota bacterium]